MKLLGVCEKDILCVNCTNDKCYLSGSIESDCPKYNCSDGDCENCTFIKEFQVSYRSRNNESR